MVIDEATQRLLHLQCARPDLRTLSFGRFRMLCLMTVLYEKLGVRYNRGFSEGEYDGHDDRNLFIHGVLTGHGGTCVTMPVLVAALGRRLSYPLKLVYAKQHMFCRWDGPNEKFNIETTSPGFNERSDSHYLRWPLPIMQRELDKGWYLRSLSPKEELAFFLAQRGHCLTDHWHAKLATIAYSYAANLAKDNENYHYMWGCSIIMERAVEAMDKQIKENPESKSLVMPAPKEDWEKRMYPEVYRNFRRIADQNAARIKKRAAQAALTNA